MFAEIIGSFKKNLLLYLSGLLIIGFYISYVLYSGFNKSISIEDNIPKYVYVDLSGAVHKPGVYELLSGALVADVLKLGDGVLSDVSIDWVAQRLNLSQKLEDEQKIYIPFEWEFNNGKVESLDPLILEISEKSVPDSSVSPLPSGDSSSVNVNTASLEGLDDLSGIGPAYAQRIVDNRPYADFNDLVSKSGVKLSTLEELEALIIF